MTPEEKSLLERTYKLAEENNDILRGIRRSNRWATAMRIGYWVIIIVTSVGAYLFIQPYLSLLGNVAGSASGGFNLQSAQDAAKELQSLFK